MSKPFLSQFAIVQERTPLTPPRYNTEDEALQESPEVFLTGSFMTEAKGDPTSDESTDR